MSPGAPWVPQRRDSINFHERAVMQRACGAGGGLSDPMPLCLKVPECEEAPVRPTMGPRSKNQAPP
jgi:hypothetical protein